MKKQGLINILAVLIMSAFIINDPIDDLELGKRGAATKEELPEVVFNAIKMNDFEMLQNFIPNQAELEYLKKNTPRKDRYIYESLDAETIKSNSEKNFQKIIQEGITKGVNWSEVEMMDNRVTQGKHADERIQKGIFAVQTMDGEPMVVSFDMIKIKNKWFVLQGMRVEEQANKKASMY